MWKKLIVLIFLGGVSFGAYEYFRAGLHTRPTMPDGAFSVSFKSGFRAIALDQADLRPNRVYQGYPLDVPEWLQNVWSWRDPASDEEKFELDGQLAVGQRLEAVCRIDVDGEKVVRGFLFSRPNL